MPTRASTPPDVIARSVRAAGHVSAKTLGPIKTLGDVSQRTPASGLQKPISRNFRGFQGGRR